MEVWVPVAEQPRIFDPFFTTKPVGRGTGQGLSIARDVVVDKHGGTLTFETEIGRGSTFFVSVAAGRVRRSRAGGAVTAPSLRVVFVDDEPYVLQALSRLLRPMHAEWQMEFAPSAPAALEILAQGPFDAVVTDMRMPGMDGAELLDEVKRRHPHVVRIVLSGQADQASVLRSLGSTHQYLSKPCDPETLKQTLVRACAVRMLLADDALKQVVSQLGSLPSLPTTYVALLDECRAPDASVIKVADAISQDMAKPAPRRRGGERGGRQARGRCDPELGQARQLADEAAHGLSPRRAIASRSPGRHNAALTEELSATAKALADQAAGGPCLLAGPA